MNVLPRLEGAVGDGRGSSGASAGLVQGTAQDLEPVGALAGLPQVERAVVAALLQGGRALLGRVALPVAVAAPGVLHHHPRYGGTAVQPVLKSLADARLVPEPLLLTRRGDDARAAEVLEQPDHGLPEPGASVTAGPDRVAGLHLQERELLEGGADGHARAHAVAADLGHDLGHGDRVVWPGQHVNRLAVVEPNVLAGELDHGFLEVGIFRERALREQDAVGGEAQGHGHQRVVGTRVRGSHDGISNLCQGCLLVGGEGQ